MPRYGRSINSLRRKSKSKSMEAVLKRGNNPRAWNRNIGLRKKNTDIYMHPFRSKIASYMPISPPNLKSRLQTFFLNGRNSLRDDVVVFNRPGGAATNLKIAVVQCAEIYKRMLDTMRRTDYWGENVGIPDYNQPINDVAPLLVEEGEMVETPPGVEGIDQPVDDESEDEVMDGEDLEKTINVDLDIQHLSMDTEAPTEEFIEEPEEVVEDDEVYSDEEVPEEEIVEDDEVDSDEEDPGEEVEEEYVSEDEESNGESDDVIDDSYGSVSETEDEVEE